MPIFFFGSRFSARSEPGTELNAISSGAAFLRGNDEPRPACIPRLFGSKKFVASIDGNSPPPFFAPPKGFDGFCLVFSWLIFSPVGPKRSRGIGVLLFESVHELVV